MKYKLFWLSLFVLFFAVFLPMKGTDYGPSKDKIAHIILFAAISINAVFYFSKDTKQLTRTLILVSILPFATEYIQKFIPGRNYSNLDILADYVGLILGIILFIILKKHFISLYKLLGEKYIPNPGESKKP